ncbi:hypothetical protein L3Q82_004298 [Scortum barcoo]|uniref:Uncharacterized protein n=1 Tax=Scortum barcoo TaxID=214431 RepID=A0ACB8VJA3_9TELE|nr:hypothetical protein L3Q82_004298 [Scortum barcoo]
MADVAPQSFDVVLADPPYLSEECLRKVAETVKYLSKGKVLLCTGEEEEKLFTQFLSDTFYYFIYLSHRDDNIYCRFKTLPTIWIKKTKNAVEPVVCFVVDLV